jgi:hypothetical protein
MATIDQFDPNKQKEEGGQQLSQAQNQMTNPGQQTMAQPGTSSSGRFTNMQKIMQANKPAASKLAGAVTGQVGQEIGKAETKSDEASGFRSAVQAEQNRLGQAQQLNTNIKADPTQLNDQDISSARNFMMNQTGQQALQQIGTQSQQGLVNANVAAQQAQQMQQRLGSESGRFGLLRQALAKPTYTQGQQKLDQLLLQTSAAPQIQQQQQELAKRLGAVKTGIGSLTKERDQSLADIAAGQKSAADLLTGTVGAEKTALEKAQVDELAGISAQNKELENLKTYLTGNKQMVKPEDLGKVRSMLSGFEMGSPDAQTGLAPKLGADIPAGDLRTFGATDLGRFVNTGKVGTMQDVLDEQEERKLNALEKLSGLSSLTKRGLGADALKGSFKKEDLQTGLKEAQDKLNKAIADQSVTGMIQQHYNAGGLFRSGDAYRDITAGLNLGEYLKHKASNDDIMTRVDMAGAVKGSGLSADEMKELSQLQSIGPADAETGTGGITQEQQTRKNQLESMRNARQVYGNWDYATGAADKAKQAAEARLKALGYYSTL